MAEAAGDKRGIRFYRSNASTYTRILKGPGTTVIRGLTNVVQITFVQETQIGNPCLWDSWGPGQSDFNGSDFFGMNS